MNGRLKVQYLLASISKDLEELLDEPEFQSEAGHHYKQLLKAEKSLRRMKNYFAQ